MKSGWQHAFHAAERDLDIYRPKHRPQAWRRAEQGDVEGSIARLSSRPPIPAGSSEEEADSFADWS